MKRVCVLCGTGISAMDFYVFSGGAPVCSACIVERGIRVCRAQSGRENVPETAAERPGFGAMAAGQT